MSHPLTLLPGMGVYINQSINQIEMRGAALTLVIPARPWRVHNLSVLQSVCMVSKFAVAVGCC